MQLGKKLREDCEGIRDSTAINAGMQVALRAGQFNLVVVQAAQAVGDGGNAFAEHGSIGDEEGICFQFFFVLLDKIPEADAADFFFPFDEDLHINRKLAVDLLKGGQRFHVDMDLTFVVGCAASKKIAVANSGLEGGRGPEIEWLSGLHVVMAGASLTLPVNFGRLKAHEEDFAAQVRQAEARLEATRDRVAMEVADSELRVHEGYHELELLRGSVIPANEQALQAVRANYSTGRTDFSSVLTAERSLAEARLNYYRALSEYQEARANLDRAIGDTPPLHSEVKP